MVLACVPVANAQGRFDGVEIKTAHVAGNVHMLRGAGGNVGVSVGENGLLIVDDEYTEMADKLEAALKKLGRGRPKYVLNTHWHFDHVGGNTTFGPEAVIVAHENARKRLAEPQRLFGRTVRPLPREGLPVITFDESLSFHFNGERVRAIHFPEGHTDGDIVIYFTESNVVHLGDLMFNGQFPFVDLSHGGNVEGVARNLKKILHDLPPDAKIIPGHGPLADRDDLVAYHQMLVKTTDIVRKRIAAGTSREDVIAEGLPEEWARWAAGFITTERWLEIVYGSLTQTGDPRNTGS
jgi:glyoxylase-like metal-dependent hydrolase (beta-lactamase superfamily II)